MCACCEFLAATIELKVKVKCDKRTRQTIGGEKQSASASHSAGPENEFVRAPFDAETPFGCARARVVYNCSQVERIIMV